MHELTRSDPASPGLANITQRIATSLASIAARADGHFHSSRILERSFGSKSGRSAALLDITPRLLLTMAAARSELATHAAAAT